MVDKERNSVAQPDVYWNIYLPILLDRMNEDMRKHMTESVSKYGLTSAHAIYLIALFQQGRMTQKEVTSFLDMDPANTFRIIKILEEKGFVYDDRKTPSGRNYYLYLTEIGKKVGKEVINSTITWMNNTLSEIPRTELDAMKDTLLRILMKLEPELTENLNEERPNQHFSYLDFVAKENSFETPVPSKERTE